MTPQDDRLDVLCFGEAIVDFFPEYSAADGGGPRVGAPLAEVEVFRRHLGGAPTNVAVGLARQGVRVGLLTMVGPDDFGRFVRSRLAAEGVDVSAVGTHPTHKTAITFVSVGARGERSFMFFRHPSADQAIGPEDLDLDRISHARIFHFGSSTMSREPGRSATLAAVNAATAAGCVLSTDPNLRRHLWESPDEAVDLIRRMMARSDIVKVSDDELLPLVGTDDPEAGASAIRALGAKLVFVTRGPYGCVWEGPAKIGRGHEAAETVRAVDTTGAGDAFMAGLLAVLAPHFAGGASVSDLDEAQVRAAVRRGCHLGALAVTAFGATTAIPRARAAG